MKSVVDIIVPDEAYDSTGWNGDLTAPTKNAVRDKIEAVLAGATFTGDVIVPAEAYGSGWNASNEVPTKNDVYDKIEANAVVAITFVIDGGGSVITTGQKGHIQVPFGCTINGWKIFADASGSIVVDVWKDTYANFPPVVGDSIAGSEKPTLSSVQKNEDTNLTTWTTTTVTAGDIIAFNVDSATTVTRVTVVLIATRT